MAELTIEQKAERYDSAIKRAKSKIKNDKDHVLYEDDVIEIFPELADDKEETIKDAAIEFVRQNKSFNCILGISKEDVIDWLEKQSAKGKFIEKELGCVRGYREEALRRLQELEKQGLQNPPESSEEVELIPDTDKPKFAIGAYVTDDGETYLHIIGYANNTYQLETVDGTSSHFRQEFIEKKYRLWSIEDAKEGDVLAARECLVLFKEIDGLNIKCYCTYHFMNTPMFHVDTLQNKRAFCPATRKQQVLFFQKLKEAGYEWNKKELLKIERKPGDAHYELEEFAKIVRGNLTGISKAVQELFEAKYLQLTGSKMYGGFKD